MTTNTVVYRVQNAKGQGPYREFTVPCMGYGLNEDNIWITRNAHDDDKHPTPYCDGVLDIGGLRCCAFKDLEQLSQWFTDDELCILYKYGFKVVEAPAIKVQYGHRQVTCEIVGKSVEVI